MDERIRLFGVDIDRLSMQQSVRRLLGWTREQQYSCRYVVTPNVDHVVKLQSDLKLLSSYRDASMVVVDGRPVLWAAMLMGKELPEVVPGSDLCPSLFEAAKEHGGLSVFLLGAAEGVGEKAARNIQARWPWIRVCGVHSPPMGFSAESPSSQVAVDLINAQAPDVLVIGLGAPKQEIWVHAVRGDLHTKVALCVGATIDFLSGEKARAPRWMRQVGLEWLHRLLSEPRRLLRRYAHDAWVFPRIVFMEWRKRT